MKKILIALMFPVTALACDKEVCLSELGLPCMNQETALYRFLKGEIDDHYSSEQDRIFKEYRKNSQSAFALENEYCDNAEGNLSDREKCSEAKKIFEEIVFGDPNRFDYEKFASDFETAKEENIHRFALMFRYDDVDHFKSLILKEVERLSIIDTRK